MKKAFCLLFLLQTTSMFSQQFPFLSDPGSENGSFSSTVFYYASKTANQNLTKEVNNFNIQYSKRTVYLNGISIILSQKINSEISSTYKRYQQLVSRNNSMSVLNYKKKKKNAKILDIIDRQINNIKNSLLNQHSVNVQNGEKLNLYMDTMESLLKINQDMDSVEDAVEQSILLDFITRRKKI